MNSSQLPQDHGQSDTHAEPSADEVRTPTWLTTIGLGLFVLAGVGWLMTRPAQLTIEQMRAAQSPPADSAAASAEGAAPATKAPQPVAQPKPSGSSPERRPQPALRDLVRSPPAATRGP